MSNRDSELLHVITKILIQTIKKEVLTYQKLIQQSMKTKTKKSMESLYERLKPLKRKVT